MVAVLVLLGHLALPSPELSPLLLAYVGVVLAAWLGGFAAGLSTVVLTALAANFAFMPPLWAWATSSAALAASVVYVMSGAAVAFLCASFRRTALALAHERQVVLALTARRPTGAEAAEEALARAEEELRRSQSTLDQILEALPIGLIVADAEGRIVRHNAATRELWGVPPDTTSWEEYGGWVAWWPATGERIRAEEWALSRALRRGESTRGELIQNERFVTHERRYFLQNVTPLRDDQGRVVGGVAAMLDVTERLAIENELRASERKFRSVFEQASIGMGRVRFEDARFIDANDALCHMLGYDREDLLRVPWPEITHPEDVELDLAPFRRMAVGELDAYTVEKRFVHARGHHVWTRLTLSLVRDDRGRPDYEVAIVEDITQRKAAEEALRRVNQQLVDADRRRTEFLAVLSHELRNPLAPIRNAVQLLERAAPGSEQAGRALQVIERQSQHLVRLVEDLLDVTRVSRGRIALRRELLDLRALVRATVADYQEVFDRRGVHLKVEEATSRPLWVEGDRTRLAQVVGNLLGNAAKFTGHGGTTVVSIEANPSGEAVVQVRDDGAGIAPETLLHLFEPFAQAEQTLDRSRGGLGLGLALVRGLVEMHGGRATADSDGPGKGAEFTISLPLRSPPADSRPAAAAEPQHAPRRQRVLVVEDNLDMAESLRELLEQAAHHVLVASTGPDGVDEARRSHPEVVICDIGLPGLDGYGVARALRSDPDPTLRSTFLVAVSGYALPQDVERSKQAGFDAHLSKPLDLDELERLLLRRVGAAR